MKDYELSKEKIAELEKLHRSLRDKRQADRVKAVIALSRGWSAAQVAEILLFDEKTSRPRNSGICLPGPVLRYVPAWRAVSIPRHIEARCLPGEGR